MYDERWCKWVAIAIATAAATIGIGLCIAIQARAEEHSADHKQNHAKLHGWYSSLKSPRTGYSCCSSMDCRAAPEARYENGQWSVIVNGERVAVPQDLVIKPDSTENPTVESHVCHHAWGHDVLCFVPAGGGI